MANRAHQMSKLHYAQQTSIKTITWFLVGISLANQLGCYTEVPRDMTTASGGPKTGYYWNCGLNVGYVTIRLFHKDVNIYKFGDEINAGAYLERDVSLLDLKKAFEKYGLVAEGFKADELEEIIGFSKPDNILIVRFESCREDIKAGHFTVVKGGRDHVIVLDPPYHPKKFTTQGIIEDGILGGVSGEFLVVYEP